MSFVINIMKLFLKTDDKLILFVSYGGRHFSDSPKVIYDAMKQDKRFESYKLIWAFVEPNKYDVEGKIKIDSWKYYKYALKSRCWITNVMVERALNFKGINTYYFLRHMGCFLSVMARMLQERNFLLVPDINMIVVWPKVNMKRKLL